MCSKSSPTLNKDYLQTYTALNTFIYYMHTSIIKALSWIKKILATAGSSLAWSDQFIYQALIDIRLYLTVCTPWQFAGELLECAIPLNKCIVPFSSSHCSLTSFRMGLYTGKLGTTYCNSSPVTKKVTYAQSWYPMSPFICLPFWNDKYAIKIYWRLYRVHPPLDST